jgi:hypothetical protein
MASQNGEYTYTFGGITYRLALEDPDNTRIQELADEIRSTLPNPSSAETIHSALMEARRREKKERIEKAKKQFRDANFSALERGEDPTKTSNGNVIEGVAGISQERTTALPKIVGAQSDVNPEEFTPVTDEEKQDRILTLAESLDIQKDQLVGEGFALKPIEPRGSNSMDMAVDMAYQTLGAGHQFNQAAQMFYGFDRFEKSMVVKNVEYTGYTFITRPRCNFSLANLAQDRNFAAMLTTNHQDVSFYVRCMLDTRFCKQEGSGAEDCKMLNRFSPFCNLLCNNLVGISGFVDPFLQTETTDGGYFQESQVYAIGGDRLARTYEMPLTFKDMPGSPVAYSFDMWYRYIMNIQDGSMVQYGHDVDANRLGYTVSIYRFIMDRSRRIITKWAKCTGCFPVNSPVGIAFNKSPGEIVVNATDNFTINFKANRIEYNDPIIIQEFNTLVRRYACIDEAKPLVGYAMKSQNNFYGLPYVRATDAGYELIYFKDDADEIVNAALRRGESLEGTNWRKKLGM